ncbi:MAG: hypothetical protein CSA33_01715 [Desulfobulbus propionicus]|nr:MAG: hypothetical protein CSA33_01715 [Desulfobulbus propionicus]
MQTKQLTILLLIFFCLSTCDSLASEPGQEVKKGKDSRHEIQLVQDVPEMLQSLLELKKSLHEEMKQSQNKLKNSKSETEKSELEKEIAQLDKQLSESTNDFERMATGIEPGLFKEKVPVAFSWKDELASLLEPAIKELKHVTVKVRKKTELKDKIAELEKLQKTAQKALINLNAVLETSSSSQVKKEIQALLPQWENANKRIANKLDLNKRELYQLQKQEVSFVETSGQSLRTFFKNRGLYLVLSLIVFFAILTLFRILYRMIVALAAKLTPKKEQRSFNIRLLYIIFKCASVFFAILGCFFTLYLAEDWLLLSMAIIFFLGFSWTIRQVLPKFWQQGRIMLNLGSVRENERLILHGVPWQVVSINVFCKLVNPSLQVELRLPIEELIGLVSRPYSQDEPWFPCKKGDWVVVGSASRARVVSLSHEQVETIERGGRRVTYPTSTFLEACPANLSRNFRVRVIFGLSYDLQKEITTEVPARMKEFIQGKIDAEGYGKTCFNLNVEFLQANVSSLDLLIAADFDGELAAIYTRLERSIQRWCVECSNHYGWEIPFPQLTIHKAAEE